MKLKMLVDTTSEGHRYLAGEPADLPNEVAQRWIKNHIATAEKAQAPAGGSAQGKKGQKTPQ